jgi:hypothetical protein
VVSNSEGTSERVVRSCSSLSVLLPVSDGPWAPPRKLFGIRCLGTYDANKTTVWDWLTRMRRGLGFLACLMS